MHEVLIMKNTMEIVDVKPKVQGNLTASLLDAFDLLKGPKDDTRLTGGAKIISQLQSNETEKDLQYTLKRVIRSLGANSSEQRAGFFAALVGLLNKFEQISVSQIFDLIKKELHANGSSKSEVGDVALGQILVCGAIFRSGLMLKCKEEDQCEVIKLILNASKKKSYLTTVAYLILLDFAKGLDKNEFSSIVWSNVKGEFKKSLNEHTLDSLYFLLVVSKKFPESVKLKKLLGNSDILCEDNIHVLCEKLMGGIDFSLINHPIFTEIGINIAKSPHLQIFWTSGIDSQLVKHNRNRELVAINILTTILNNLDDNFVVLPELISRNFFKLFMDWFKGLQTASKVRNKKDTEDDNKIMIKKEKELLNTLSKVMKSEKVTGEIRVAMLKKLLIDPGEINFTEITGTTVIKSIIADLGIEEVKKMGKLFRGILKNSSKKHVKEDIERNWYNNERLKAAELLSYLVSHESVKEDTDFKLTYMKLLMCFGFFKIGGDEKVAISNELSGAIKTCFYRCFTSKFSNVDSLVTVLCSLSDFISSTMAKENIRIKLEKQFPKENMECWEMLVNVCQNIQNNVALSKVDKVFLILLHQLGLFLFSEPVHVKMAKSSIKELNSCYEHYKKGEKKVNHDDLSEDEPEWIEVLIEVLLSILSTESSILRSVVQCVFRLLWEYLTPSSIEQIVSVLDPENEDNPLAQDDETDNEESSDEDSEPGDDKNNSVEENEKKSDIESDDEIDLDDEDEDMKTPDQLRLAVQQALTAVGKDDDNESIDADMIDEEEGKKLDDALAEAFRQFHQGKNKKSKKERKDKKALSDFRIRVLDLIDIYLEKDPAMDICLSMIAPLTRCLEFCIQDNQFNELEHRVRKTIKMLTKIRKFSTTDNVDINVLSDYLKSFIEKGSRSHFLYQALGDVITHFATFIISCSQKISCKSPKKKKSSPLFDVFNEALQSYFQNRNCLLPIIFFHNVLQTEWESNYDLIPIIIDNIFNNNVRQFRRNEGIELIAGFYRALKRSKPTSEKLLKKLSNIEAKFENTLINTLKETEYEAKHNFFVLLKKLINTMKMIHESCHIDTNLDFTILINTVASCKGVKSNKIQNGVHDGQNKANDKRKKIKKRRYSELGNGHEETKHKKIKEC